MTCPVVVSVELGLESQLSTLILCFYDLLKTGFEEMGVGNQFWGYGWEYLVPTGNHDLELFSPVGFLSYPGDQLHAAYSCLPNQVEPQGPQVSPNSARSLPSLLKKKLN